MKKMMVVMLVAVVMTGVFAANASAANGLKEGAAAFGVNVNDDFVLSGRYFLSNDLALLALFGFGLKGGDASGTDAGIGIGIRKYLSTEDFAPFVGGVASYRTTQDDNLKEASILAVFGAEYFFEKRFSVEGSVGFGYTSIDDSTGPAKVSENTIGTQRVGLSLNFYFL